MNKTKEQIRIAAVIGSVRDDHMTGKVLGLALDQLKTYKNVAFDVIDPSGIHLVNPGKVADDTVKHMQDIISGATGVILSTPEYHGSYSSTIKLVIDNLGYPSVLAGKPVALLGVASGQIGAIKALEHLRSVCSHVGSIVLPGPVSVAGVHKLFDEAGHCLDEKVEKRVRGLADNLLDYITTHICPHIALEEIVRGG